MQYARRNNAKLEWTDLLKQTRGQWAQNQPVITGIGSTVAFSGSATDRVQDKQYHWDSATLAPSF